MTIKTARWVHGNIARAEYEDRLVSTVRRGWGIEFEMKAKTSNWFHFPLTTPVLLDDYRPKVSKVFVLYSVGADNTIGLPWLNNVHLYDGTNKVWEWQVGDHSHYCGNHSSEIDANNSWVIDPPITIYSGLGISVQVCCLLSDFPGGGKSFTCSFATVGADFI